MLKVKAMKSKFHGRINDSLIHKVDRKIIPSPPQKKNEKRLKGVGHKKLFYLEKNRILQSKKAVGN